MRRYYYNRKLTVEQSCGLSIYSIKRYGLLNGYNSTIITWTNSRTGQVSAIRLTVDTGTDSYARFEYALTDNAGNKTDHNYEVSLTTTPCKYGGERYWFACPSCGRRVGVLYLAPGYPYFVCRHCNNLTYLSRNWCRITRLGHIGREREKLQKQIKRWTWRGLPTRKARKLLNLQQKESLLAGAEIARLKRWKSSLS